MNKQPFVILEGVSKDFENVHALQKISLQIFRGEMTTLVGPDGAGKTTLIRLITGLLVPTEGTITVAGWDTVQEAGEISKLIGYMPQRFGLYEDLTVIQNMNLYADLKGLYGPEKKESFEELLSFTNLKPFTDRLAGKLSGGMKQKLGLACAFIRKPTLLLLDEPSVGVDPISRRELWKIVKNLLKEGTTILWSTAYLDEAERSEKTLLLNEGKLLYEGPPAELKKRVENRVYKIENVKENRRLVLKRALEQKEVIDGVIQGNSIRIVTKEKGISLDPKVLEAPPESKIVKESPRYEDAFIDILGGGPKEESKLAKIRPKVEGEKEKAAIAHKLTKQFGSFKAVIDVSFDVFRGEIFGLLGPNGAGKSTIFKMMCGLLKPTQGQAIVMGFDLQTHRGEGLSRIGYMAQKFSLYGDLSVLQNLNFFSGIYYLPPSQRRKKVEKMIEIFNFREFLNESAKDLPLGYKQRLSLACSVMHDPEVLFLDEPTSGVDPLTRREFWNHINGLVEKNVTVIVTTHFMDEAEYCDRIGLIDQGRLMTIGAPDELKENAKTEEIPNPTLEEAFIYLIKKYGESRNSFENEHKKT